MLQIFTSYEKNLWDCGYDAYPRLENSLFDAVKLVKNGDLISTNVLDIECFQ